MIVYMSLIGNTRKFVNKINHPNIEITLDNCLDVVIDEPYILVTPTYAEETTDILWDFLENETNRAHCKGVFGGGNRNFAELFCYTAKNLSKEFSIPLLHLFEFQGSPHDVSQLEKELMKIGKSKSSK